jgi:hypothetical protein
MTSTRAKPHPDFNDLDGHAESAWPEAFSYVREANHPCVLMINGERWKLYPSGQALRQPPVGR